jgi:hypothetical protein
MSIRLENFKHWIQIFFHPLNGIPVPDFNNQYDASIL